MSENLTTGLDFKISEVAARIKELRQIDGISVETMAKIAAKTEEGLEIKILFSSIMIFFSLMMIKST